ncbi:MAG: hypothetical protein JRF33_17595 [Deltaproteobacteria bacterium]|nr:hypothetical protein [Deltaproteobacteria bacterium]
MRRFVIAIEGEKTSAQINRNKYIWLHNVLPYALFNASGGLVVAFSRFAPFYQRGEPVDSHTLAWHLALTALAISLFVVTAAKFKTRVDFLSPIQFDSSAKPPKKRTWRLAYALAAPFVTYFLLRLAMMITGREALRAGEAMGLKLIVCLSLALLTAHWAVSSTLARLEQGGLKEHPYVRLHRFLRTAGIIDPFRRKRPH